MKLLICDDDISTIDVIQSQLDCQELGITRILRAYHGEAAMELILKEKPELILCDIGMPKVDGVEVLKFIHDRKIHTEFAFLTCFDDFGHAKDALRYGARNYLTKPVDFQELKSALRRMAEDARIWQELQADGADETRKDLTYHQLLRRFLHAMDDESPEGMDRAFRESGITELRADTRVRLLMTYVDLTRAAAHPLLRDRPVEILAREIDQVLTDHEGIRYTVADRSERYLSSLTLTQAALLSEGECLSRAEGLIRRLDREYALPAVILVGEEAPLVQIRSAGKELRNQMRKVLIRTGNVFLQRDTAKITGSDQPAADPEKILRLIRQRDRKGYLDLVEDALRRIAVSRYDTSNWMNTLRREIAEAFSAMMMDNHLSFRELIQSEDMRELDIYAERSPEDMRRYAARLYDLSLEKMENAVDAERLIDSVKFYIRQHYREDLTRNDLAEVVHITPNYLSRRFHSETGMSLREYINQLRVEEAKRLLISTNATISEIASEVGFENISYFSTVFRKICGVSPVEWSRGTGERKEKEP